MDLSMYGKTCADTHRTLPNIPWVGAVLHLPIHGKVRSRVPVTCEASDRVNFNQQAGMCAGIGNSLQRFHLTHVRI